MSYLPDWLSDSLCRAVTGNGDVRRRLYTDGDLAVFAFRRCIILANIDIGATHGDLADRLLPIHLDIIPSDKRLEENELWPRWQEAHPRILGAVLDLASAVEGARHSVTLATKPRMADFGRILAAVDNLLGTDGLRRYVDKQGALALESLTADLFIMAFQGVLGSEPFAGTSAELLAFVPTPDHVHRDWPLNARQVTQRLARQAPVMRKAGWGVENDQGANKGHTVRWTITAPRTEMACISGSPGSPGSPVTLLARQASQASHGNAPSLYDPDFDQDQDYVGWGDDDPT